MVPMDIYELLKEKDIQLEELILLQVSLLQW